MCDVGCMWIAMREGRCAWQDWSRSHAHMRCSGAEHAFKLVLNWDALVVVAHVDEQRMRLDNMG